MKISIITPSWNQGRFLRKCLESIRVYPNIEVEHILLDNCSDDETPVILAEYMARDDGVDRHFVVELDAGQTQAINDGFRRATGDVICWLNTDEWYIGNALEKVADFFLENPDTDIFYGNCDFMDAEGSLVKRRRSMGFNKDMLLYYGCFISSAATFVRRKVIDEEQLLNNHYRVAMDYEWYVRLASLGYRFSHGVEALACFTWHETNISMMQRARSFEERLKIQKEFGNLSIPQFARAPVARALRAYWKAVRGAKRVVLPIGVDGHGPRGWMLR